MLDLSLFENPAKNIFILKKWSWDYIEAERLQLASVEYVSQNPHVSIFIMCSHNSCFTIGRGLQKIKENLGIELVDFDKNIELPYPIHQIKRGGGLTFHYPGQFVFYPIINLTFHKIAVHDFMISIMEMTRKLLENYFLLHNLKIRTDLLGLWFEERDGIAKKIASIGLATSKFNTYHGMALNFFNDKEMLKFLVNLYPCGIPGDTYVDVESIGQKVITNHDREMFTDLFKKLLIDKFNESR